MNARWLLRITALPVLMACAAPVAAAVIDVVRSPSCGCCGKWVEHLPKAGHKDRETHTDNPAATSKRFGVKDDLGSCHSARVGRHVIEGHVPATAVARLLTEKPTVAGLAVSGRVAGSPGMETGDEHLYQTIAFTRDGKRRMFARH